ncbi:NMUR2 [Mytilus coruscus]|uniref:NMUR2 n=1 Tax=Mytilus coruscus TaxID=42192 RepID=A0A6J8DP82_MYTCO|nr:NMUR2 [Mytilus coruscus]
MTLNNMVTLHRTSFATENSTANHLLHVTNDDREAEVNTGYSEQILGTTITLGCIGFFGLIGNLLVIMIYGFKSKHTTNRIFFVGLAMTDMLVCIITLPSEIIELNNDDIFEQEYVCKISYFLTYTFVIGSALTLIPLSVDRYNRICKPFQPQWQPTNAVTRVCVVYALAVVFSLPNLLIRGLQFHTSDANVTEQYCMFAENYVNTWISLSYNSFIFLIPLVTIIILSIIYILIGKNIIAHNRFRNQFRKYTVSTVCSENDTTDKKVQRDTSAYRITKIAFIIVVTFFVSYVPTAGLKLYEAVFGLEPYSTSKFTIMLLTFRFSYLLNHVVNPFAYGILDIKFRKKIALLFHIKKTSSHEESYEL